MQIKSLVIFMLILLVVLSISCKKKTTDEETATGSEQSGVESEVTTPNEPPGSSEYVFGSVTHLDYNPYAKVGEDLQIEVQGLFPSPNVTFDHIEVSIKEEKQLVELTPVGLVTDKVAEPGDEENKFSASVTIQIPSSGNWRLYAPGKMKMLAMVIVATD